MAKSLADHAPCRGLTRGLWIQAMRAALPGPPGVPGEGNFDITVCTPEWLAA